MTDNRQQRLVVRVGRNSLSFSTTNGSEGIYEPYPMNASISVAANLREALRTVALLGAPYGQVLVMVDTPVLMVPALLFVEEEADTLYRHTFTVEEQTVVMHTVLPDLNAVALFPVLKDLRGVITDHFRQVTFSAAVTPVWRHLYRRSFTGQRQKLYAYFHDQRMEVFAYAQGRFKFCNSFVAQNADDALFYLLSVWKQLAMAAEHDELFFVGDFAERDALMERVQMFVKRVFLINPSGEFNRAAVTQIAGIPYDLITLYMKGR